MAKREEIIVGLDLGTTKVCTVVAELAEEGQLKVLGVGTAACDGLNQGMVVSIDETAAAISRSVDEAETMSGVDIHRVVAGISGAHLKGLNNRATVGVKGAEVTADDIAGVLDAARAVELSRDDEIVHVAPQKFVIDNQDAVGDPIGMAGDLLSVEAHVILGAATATRNLMRCVEQAGLEVDSMVPQPLASAHSVLSPEELELGVVLVDIGGGTTDLAVFVDGSVRHTWVLPLGASHVTRDISYGLSTPIKEAERIKVQFGTALSGQVDEIEEIEVPSVGGRPPRNVTRKLLAQIAEARMEEILQLVGEEIHRAGLAAKAGSGLVITGGGSLLPGTVEVAGRMTGLIARCGMPISVTGLTDLATSPKNATAVGLARGALMGATMETVTLPAPKGLGRLKHWVQEFF
ncbi:MAG: cell division protein FtsA [Leptospirillia bacterium]